MSKILVDKWMLAKLISIVFLFTIFPIGKIQAREDGNNFIDYVAIYNQKSRPANYKEEDNAAAYYQKAIKAYVSAPQEIRDYDWRIWAGDFSEQSLQTIKQWVKSNSLALEYFIQASQKPYFWTEKKSDYGSVVNILLPDLYEIKKLTQLTCCRAMLDAMDGNIENAAKDIETVYRVGNHFKGPWQTIEQIFGINIKIMAIETTLTIIQNTHPDKKKREFLYNSLKKHIDDEEFKPDWSVAKLMCMDCLQRMCTTNKDGEKVIDEKLSKMQLALLRFHCWALVFSGNVPIKYAEPKPVTMNYEKTTELITEKLEQLEKLISLEAWQLNEVMNQENGVFQNIQESHPLLNLIVIDAVNLKIQGYERLRVETLALDVIMGVLTFKENNGRLPLDLGELQKAGLLEKIPIDPFSGKPIVYKKLGDNFTVYSYGFDFEDDGGVRVVDYNGSNGDIVVWPVKKYKAL
jgi:hypothetical protein